MWTFLARRLLQSIIVLIGVTLISFISLQIGGDPTYLFVSENASAEEIARARAALGFDRPLHVQYISYVWNALQGDFGNSLSYRQPAMGVVIDAMPATIELTLFSLILAIALSIPLGIYAALKRGKPADGGIARHDAQVAFAKCNQCGARTEAGRRVCRICACVASANNDHIVIQMFHVKHSMSKFAPLLPKTKACKDFIQQMLYIDTAHQTIKGANGGANFFRRKLGPIWTVS